MYHYVSWQLEGSKTTTPIHRGENYNSEGLLLGQDAHLGWQDRDWNLGSLTQDLLCCYFLHSAASLPFCSQHWFSVQSCVKPALRFFLPSRLQASESRHQI